MSYYFIQGPSKPKFIFSSPFNYHILRHFFLSLTYRQKFQLIIIRVRCFFGLFRSLHSPLSSLNIPSDLINFLKDRHFVLYTGISGPDCKIVIAYLELDGNIMFIKRYFNEEPLNVEISGYEYLKKLPKNLTRNINYYTDYKNTLVIPCIGFQSLNYSSPIIKIFKAHLDFTFNKGVQIEIFNINNFFHPETILNFNFGKKELRFINQIFTISSRLQNFRYLTAPAHGDFTPWNVLYDKNEFLNYIDFEFFNLNKSITFDYIHFILQSGILLNHKSINALYKDLFFISDFFSDYVFDDDFLKYYIILYMVEFSLSYIIRYSNVSKHIQYYWLLDSWCGLLDIISSDDMTIL